MRRRLTILLLAAILLAAAISWLTPNYASVLEANWGIALSFFDFWREIYQADTGPSFHGDGVRYHVFSSPVENAAADLLPWQEAQGQSVYRKSYSDELTQWLEEIDVPAEYLPHMAQCVFWYDFQPDNSQILILWNRETGLLYVAENFI